MATQVKRKQIDTSLIDGWTPVTDTWTYASASTITVPSGAASIYQKGDRIKWTQTTVKYGVIVAVADTVLTIAVNTDYVVANAAISAIYYSHQANPLGYPHWFNFTPTLNEVTVGSGTNVGKYQIIGYTISLTFKFTMGVGSSITGNPNYSSLPVNPANARQWDTGRALASDSGTVYNGSVSMLADNTIYPSTNGATTLAAFGATVPFVWGSADYWTLQISYEF
jgi:hypothetical protein